jgi:VIT1/CCC1 family predicted Fe2+/Mn2+ transporter
MMANETAAQTRSRWPWEWFRKKHHETTEEAEQRFLLQVIQPALVGLMDGSVSTLAPIFATAYATHNPMTTFLVGVAAAVGAGISMGFAEGLSDDGTLTGRGNPLQRGFITGFATFLGGILHTLPFLISHIQAALWSAYVVVAVELFVISWIRFRYFKMPWTRSTIQVIVGGALVFAAGVLIGSA